ncbi:response regulator [Paenibacillus hodogayensis]|uniref:Response regulator n=1 Tax=Paenibacillus hodogayensis TaxID=279208 RepID=A0ABV5W7T2_9BACL
MLFCLIVDDEKWILNGMVNRVNACEGFATAGTARNGQAALDWLQNHYADILITDVRMPVMDGLELVKEVNARYPWMKSVLISSYDDFEYARRGISLGTIDYIMKPADQERLEGALHAAAQQLSTMRSMEARALMLKRYDSALPMLRRWQEYPVRMQASSPPLLVMETFKLLEAWAEPRIELLAALADEWIAGAAGKRAEALFACMAETFDRAPIPFTEDVKLYWRLNSVYRLEIALEWLNSPSGMNGMTAGRRAVSDVKRFIESHYQEKLNLQQIADAVNVSKPYLANVFRQETGLTIWGYLIEVRMRKAKELFLMTDKRMGEVAELVGYTDMAHFAKTFKNYYGMSSTGLKNRFSGADADHA